MSDNNISILSLINEYREVARGIWNSHFKGKFETDSNWYYVDSFKTIRRELFNSMVFYPMLKDVPDDFRLGTPTSLIRLKLSVNGDTCVMISREKNGDCGYWDHPVTKISADAELRFIDFFDWNSYGFLDMAQVLAQIVKFPENPELEGHRLLVDLIYVDMVMDGGQSEPA